MLLETTIVPDSPHTLANSRVRLFSLNTDFLKHYAFCVGRATEGGGLEGRAEQSLLVVQICPSTLTSVVAQLARRVYFIPALGVCAVGWRSRDLQPLGFPLPMIAAMVLAL
jgi:hypothetical protein